MKRPAKAILFGMCIGILGMVASMLPFVLKLEEYAGLDWLFTFRGPITPPPDVVIVSIDKASADALGLPAEPVKWPRRYHATLINNLARSGAVVIALDIFFKEPRDPQGDAELAKAIDAAGNVVLFEYTKKEMTRLHDDAGNPAGEMLTQRLETPVTEIADAALALAPFPLPVFPVKVSQFWTFTPGTGDLPTLPVVTLQLFEARKFCELLGMLEGMAQEFTSLQTTTSENLFVKGAASEAIRSVRANYRNNPILAESMNKAAAERQQGRVRNRLLALTEMYRRPDSRYLNYYGPPQTITTIPYFQAVEPIDLKGKAVFVGYSERLQPERLDEFFTVFSQDNGLHLSGVEIAATAFANLLENKSVTPLALPAQFLLLLGWGVLLGISTRMLSIFPAMITTIVFAGAYFIASQILFNRFTIWLPLIVPLFIQLSFALFAAALWHYREAHSERENIRAAFGYYLPPSVVDHLANDRTDGRTQSKLMYATCLSTDARQYTSYSEAVDPETLGERMNAYYKILFEPIRKHGGTIIDVVGDSMLAIWPSHKPDREMRISAIKAAIEVDAVMQDLEIQQAPHYLPTRIGLHTGKILLGSIGALDHYEYRPIGDIVNTSSRIEGLNKHIGTRVLVSDETLVGVGDVFSREVGTFLLSGKTQSLVIHELQGNNPGKSEQQRLLFAEGLAAFRLGVWPKAILAFEQLLSIDKTDLTVSYYLGLCKQYKQQQPRDSWDGIVRLTEK